MCLRRRLPAARWPPRARLCSGPAPGAFDGAALRSARRFLAGGGDFAADSPRVFGAQRFDPETAPSEEWAPFGGHAFFLPALEVGEGARAAYLACCVAWDGGGSDETSLRKGISSSPEVADDFAAAAARARRAPSTRPSSRAACTAAAEKAHTAVRMNPPAAFGGFLPARARS